jgi:hypothetical protein
MSGILPERLEALLIELDELWRPSRVTWTLSEVPGAAGLKLSHSEMTREWATNAQTHRGVTRRHRRSGNSPLGRRRLGLLT